MKECFIDIHCHLEYCADVDAAVKAAKELGVGIIVSAGVNRGKNRVTLGLAEEHPEVKPSLGMYPVDALSITEKEIDEEIEFIGANRKIIFGIGEIGIDLKEAQDFERQKAIFEKFVKLGIEIDKPVIVHSRKAEKECIEILENLGAKKVIMHCFCGKRSLVKKIIENGWYLTIPTSVNNSKQFQENAQIVPIEQLFCETDSPFLHPEKLRDNEPKNVVVSYQWIAKQKNMSLEEVKNKIFENYGKLSN